MDTQNAPTIPALSPNTTVGQLRVRYGESFAEGYEDTDPMTAVLGRAGTSSLGEYLHLHRPPSQSPVSASRAAKI